MNITDVGHLVSDADSGEDKLALAAKKEGKSAWQIASFYTDAFFFDTDRLNIERPHSTPKAADHIKDQIALIQQLDAKGFIYQTSDGVYFDIQKFPGYAILGGQSLTDLEAGARVEINPDKRHWADFALWKFSPSDTKRDMEWESPWGTGFPGWHLECSAMSVNELGQPFDLHAGGIDHIFPHHTNEIAQSQAATGLPLANFWLHGAFMLVDSQKMGKSLGNTFTLQDIVERGHAPLAFRYLALQTHYRKQLNFTWQALASAEQALFKLSALAECLPEQGNKVPVEIEENFRAFIADDLALPQAIALFWEVLKSNQPDEVKAQVIVHWDQIFGLGLKEKLGQGQKIPFEIQRLLKERDQARLNKNFVIADRLRQQIEEQGFTVHDKDAESFATRNPNADRQPFNH